MKKLLNTLFVTSSDTYLALDGENIVVKKDDDILRRIPLHNLNSVVAFSYTGASPALMSACAKRSIDLVFMTPSGRFLARVSGEVRGNVLLRKAQYRLSENELQCVGIAKNFLIGKVYNAKWVIERAKRDYPDRLDTDKLRKTSLLLSNSIMLLGECKTLEELRGIEGEAACLYFGLFDDLILQQKEDFKFENRIRRPPTDPVNALLSFIYTMLANDCAAALESVGLDPYVGFLHKDRPGRVSLALDLMEEMRSVFADRFVLTLINKRIINIQDFLIKENNAVILTDTARKTVLSSWQEKKQDTIIHPFLEEKIEWGLVPYVQSLLLARFIRGDLDEYPPFLWK